MKKISAISLSIFILLQMACIGDDFIDDFTEPTLSITSNPDTIEINTMYQFTSLYLNNVGIEENPVITWESSDPSVISIDSEGLSTTLSKGVATISASLTDGASTYSDMIDVYVGDSTVESTNSSTGEIITTSSYVLEGSFVFQSKADGVEINIADNYKASTALPGLYLYLSNNKNSVASAYEVGAVTVFNGAHNYTISGVGFDDYKYLVYFCKPFNVKVGEAEL